MSDGQGGVVVKRSPGGTESCTWCKSRVDRHARWTDYVDAETNVVSDGGIGESHVSENGESSNVGVTKGTRSASFIASHRKSVNVSGVHTVERSDRSTADPTT
ncbi:unannotated protein [freshwater metagenome]|uniref:Unannotated protein n=1 Tax=freshwater metagenome TaxID=449393 RepID=A0A6J6XF48_9ZZZZ